MATEPYAKAKPYPEKIAARWRELYGKYFTHITANKSSNTACAYERAVRKFLLWCDVTGEELESLSPGAMISWLDCERTNNPRFGKNTARTYCCGIRSFLKMLPAWGITPTQQIEPNFGPQRAQIHPCLSLEQLQEVIGAVRDQVPYPYKGIFLMLAMTGMRVSEVLKLQLEHLDWQPEPDGSTTLYLSVLYGKTGDRRIPVHSTLQGDMVDYLYEWRFKHHKKSKLVFPCRVSGGHITYNSFYTYAKPFMASLGFEGFKLHTFRRSWLTLMLQQGMSVPEISRYAGHSNIAITSRYLHIPPEQLNASLKEHANEVQL